MSNKAAPKEEKKSNEIWARLSSLNFAKHENVNLVNESYTIGRLPDSSVHINDARLSGKHCNITFDRENGKCYLEDTSSNGTFVNNTKVGKGNKVELKNGDIIHLLHESKVEVGEIMGYVFSATAAMDEVSNKRKREEEAAAKEAAKKELEKNQTVQKKMLEDMGEEMQCVICIEYIHMCVSTIPCLHNFCAACLSDWCQKSDVCPNCREKVTEVKKNPTINNMICKFIENNPDKKRSAEDIKEMDEKNKITKDRMKIAELRPQPAGYGGGGILGGGGLMFNNYNQNIFQQNLLINNNYAQNQNNNRRGRR